MELNYWRHWFRLNMVVLVAAMCLVETTSITNQIQDQRSPETRRSLVAMLQEGPDLNLIPAGANPSTETESNTGDNSRQPGDANPDKSVIGERSTPKKVSVAEALHLLHKGQIPVDRRSVKAMQRDVFSSKEGERDVESLRQRPNGQGVISKMLFPEKKRRTNRMRREASATESLPTSSTLLPSQNPSLKLSEDATEAPTVSQLPHQTTSSNQGVLTTAEPSNPLPPVTTSTIDTKEQAQVTGQAQLSGQAQVTGQANHVSTSVSSIQPTTRTTTSTKQPAPPIISTSAPTSKPQDKVSSNPITTISHRTPSSTTLPSSLSPTNATGSQIQDVKERTPDDDCGNGNCDTGIVPLNQWTDDAYWAFGSLLTILMILTVAVLYTGLWRKRNHMSAPISDVNCQPQTSPPHKRKTDIKDLLKKKLRHIKNLNSSPLSSTSSSLSKQDTRQHNGSSARSSNGRAGNRYPHKYDRLPLLVGDDNEEEEEEVEFTREWGPRSKEHGV